MRADALWRVWAFIWAIPASFVASIVSIVGLVWGIVDVLWQLIFGTDGLSSSSRPAGIVKGVLLWPVDLTIYAFTGDGGMMWLPDV
ncbi:hypothetical protein [Haloarcula sp. Atlit-120R]|uniref:hypothetical protein n=1 Tax=Haloarcula sp. Atlit-120R TaxID=2282135 RepID=UPI000EF1EE4D|nr:hypothetical protein [Haloarcula sp. Atlit-120R]RLM32617.1 hypothetical protein DVK01_20300 [Haloarcula sp. Atlit-120R]